MNTSSRFVVAIHIMAALTLKRDRPSKSDELSKSVNTNPVVVRRILGMLRKAGLVDSQTGPDGGSRLARAPEKIPLLDIYEAVEESELFHFHYAEPSCSCPIGAYVKDSLSPIFREAAEGMKSVLRGKHLMTVTKDILDRSGISRKLEQGWTLEQLRDAYDFEQGVLVRKKD